MTPVQSPELTDIYKSKNEEVGHPWIKEDGYSFFNKSMSCQRVNTYCFGDASTIEEPGRMVS